jgi:hypothetical protein
VARQYGGDVAAKAYREIPEVVAQLHTRLRTRLGARTSDPDQVARWLTG